MRQHGTLRYGAAGLVLVLGLGLGLGLGLDKSVACVGGIAWNNITTTANDEADERGT